MSPRFARLAAALILVCTAAAVVGALTGCGSADEPEPQPAPRIVTKTGGAP